MTRREALTTTTCHAIHEAGVIYQVPEGYFLAVDEGDGWRAADDPLRPMPIEEIDEAIRLWADIENGNTTPGDDLAEYFNEGILRDL